MQHLSSILAHLINEALSDGQQSWEGCVNDLVELDSLVRLVSIDAADRKEALEPRKDRGGIVGVEQLHRDVDKGWPLVWEVGDQDLLEHGDELLSDLGRGGREDG